jgi:glycerol-3-phosphate O-acyltransferase
VTQAAFLDRPPESATLTDYDRSHMKLYMRLLDAATDGAAWQEAVSVLFGIDPDKNPERARRVHDSHLARARWMTEHGYRLLANERPPS